MCPTDQLEDVPGTKTAFLSDIHGNTPALQAVLEDVAGQQCTRVFVLGDIINGLDPHGCLDGLRAWSEKANVEITCLQGNAEAYLLTPDLDALPRAEESWNISMVALIRWFEKHLTRADWDWIASFPTVMRWQDALLLHDSPLDRAAVHAEADPQIPEKYHEWFFHARGIKPDWDEQDWARLFREMERGGYSQIYCGHTHIPFLRETGRFQICNTGSVGMPLDGDPRSSWLLLDQSTGEAVISIRRVNYDYSRILGMIDKASDYPSFTSQASREAYRQRLLTGKF